MFTLSSHTIGKGRQGEFEKDRGSVFKMVAVEMNDKALGSKGKSNPDSALCQLGDLGVPRCPCVLRVYAHALPSMCNTLAPFCMVGPSALCFSITSAERPSVTTPSAQTQSFASFVSFLHCTEHQPSMSPFPCFVLLSSSASLHNGRACDLPFLLAPLPKKKPHPNRLYFFEQLWVCRKKK